MGPDGTRRDDAGESELRETIRARFCRGGDVERIAADASTREFFRVTAHDGTRSIVLADTAGGRAAFERMLAAHTALASIGVPVPAIRDRDDALGLVAFEDLGDLLLADALDAMTVEEASRAYADAARIAATIAERGTSLVTARHVLADDPLGHERLRRELAFFATHEVAGRRGVADGRLIGRLDAVLDRVAAEAGRLPMELAHRDFHARNILVGPGGGLSVVDFQDAVPAPLYYDLVSLIFDPYVAPDEALRRGAAEAWATSRGRESDPLEDPRLAWVALQRLLKALGTYGYQTAVRGNARFASAIAPAERAALEIAERIGDGFADDCCRILGEAGFSR
jgi:aminoglycoside/choline kinase family phosphotransferase